MDVEKTIQFILNEQAKTEVMRQQNEERWRQNEERFDRKMAAINKLIITGMKMIAKHEGKINLLTGSLRELAAQQKKTERTLERFIENFNRPGSNGRKNGRTRG